MQLTITLFNKGLAKTSLGKQAPNVAAIKYDLHVRREAGGDCERRVRCAMPEGGNYGDMRDVRRPRTLVCGECQAGSCWACAGARPPHGPPPVPGLHR